MVVRNNDVHAQTAGKFYLFRGGNAAVYGNHQGNTLGGEFFHRLLIHTVAFLHTVGDIRGADQTLIPKITGQQTQGSDAVHVIVSVDQHVFFICDGLMNPDNGFVHIRHGHGVAHCVGAGVEKGFPQLLRNFAQGKYRLQ